MKVKKRTNKNPFKSSLTYEKITEVYTNKFGYDTFPKPIHRYSLKQFIKKKQAVDIQVHNNMIILLSKKNRKLYVSAQLHFPKYPYWGNNTSKESILNCLEQNPPQPYWEVEEYKGGIYTADLLYFPYHLIKSYPLYKFMRKKKAVDIQVDEDNHVIHLLSKEENGNIYISAKINVYEREWWWYLNRQNLLDYSGKIKEKTHWHIFEYKGGLYNADIVGYCIINENGEEIDSPMPPIVNTQICTT